ncbi:MAG TPA: DUF6279 family lipoprotein [Rubrivivax sp.]|nr:DUF6279 family lipoprotein [Rubrivivax sp.]
MRLSLIKSAIIGLLVLRLAACRSVRLGYGNGPLLAWWWLDGYVDFSREHAPLAKQGIDRWFEWHRATQLPGYADLLAAAAQEVLEPVTAAQACRWQDRFGDALAPALDRAVEIAADLVPTLGEAQLRHIEQRYAKGNDEMRGDFLQPEPAVRQREAVKRTVERFERIYGPLEPAQKQVIAAGVAASPFDPERWLADRERRQRETLGMLRELVATGADRDQRLASLRTLALRMERSSDPDHRAYQARLAEYNCDFAARVHNATTPEQRLKARDALKGWADDFRVLAAANG